MKGEKNKTKEVILKIKNAILRLNKIYNKKFKNFLTHFFSKMASDPLLENVYSFCLGMFLGKLFQYQ